LITKAAGDYGLDPTTLAVLIFWESGGDQNAISSDGAVGLMQVMPRDGIAATFQCPNGPCFANRPTMEELKDPSFNITYGSKMLAGLISKYGSAREGLFHYGPVYVGYSYADAILGMTEMVRQTNG